ncbi:unnamed protein product, partial [Notodromas monacha]
MAVSIMSGNQNNNGPSFVANKSPLLSSSSAGVCEGFSDYFCEVDGVRNELLAEAAHNQGFPLHIIPPGTPQSPVFLHSPTPYCNYLEPLRSFDHSDATMSLLHFQKLQHRGDSLVPPRYFPNGNGSNSSHGMLSFAELISRYAGINTDPTLVPANFAPFAVAAAKPQPEQPTSWIKSSPRASENSPFDSRKQQAEIFNLQKMSNHLAEMAYSQHGSRMIQQHLQRCTPLDREAIFSEILPESEKLMTDVFGNYVIQKLLEFGSPDQRTVLAGKALRLHLGMTTGILPVVPQDQMHQLILNQQPQTLLLGQQVAARTNPFCGIRPGFQFDDPNQSQTVSPAPPVGTIYGSLGLDPIMAVSIMSGNQNNNGPSFVANKSPLLSSSSAGVCEGFSDYFCEVDGVRNELLAEAAHNQGFPLHIIPPGTPQSPVSLHPPTPYCSYLEPLRLFDHSDATMSLLHFQKLQHRVDSLVPPRYFPNGNGSNSSHGMLSFAELISRYAGINTDPTLVPANFAPFAVAAAKPQPEQPTSWIKSSPRASENSPFDSRKQQAEIFNLQKMSNHLAEMAYSQHGSRMIQQHLQRCTPLDREAIFSEILPESEKLMTDVFGNYVIQKLLEFGSPDQRTVLAGKMKGNVLQLSMQTYGCRVVQKALETVPSDTAKILIQELHDHVIESVKDQNGNHVIQKCVEFAEPATKQFIVDAFRGQATFLSMHPYGCRVIQRILEHCSSRQVRPLVTELSVDLDRLVVDPFGNYVAQHMLEHGSLDDRTRLVAFARGKLLSLSQHKFASNVMEKCIEYSTDFERSQFLDEVCGYASDVDDPKQSPLYIMMRDQFANYVLQKMLDLTEAEKRKTILSRIAPYINDLRKVNHGKQILAKLEKYLSESGIQENFQSSP